MSNISLAVYRNVLVLIVHRDDYEDGTRLQSKRATYKEIQTWVTQKYSFHVSNLSISKDKEKYGLAKTEYKGYAGAEGHYTPRLPPEKEAAIHNACIWFGPMKRQ